MPNVTCSNCKYELHNDEELRKHYKSDLHRYNIKRALVGLAPITQETFDSRKAQVQEQQEQQPTEYKCKVCNKNFASEMTFKQHLASKKHKEMQKNEKLPMQIPNAATSDVGSSALISLDSSMISDSGRRYTTVDDENICLFCNKKSNDLAHNLTHMNQTHSFFISDEKHVTDLSGLIRYLGLKVHNGCMCIYCDNIGKDFKSGAAVQAHMIDKGHCFMNTDQFSEYSKFYDLSSAQFQEKEGYTYVLSNRDAQEDDWEDDDDIDEEEEEEEEDDENAEEHKDDKAEQARNEFRRARSKSRVNNYRFPKVEVLPTGEIQLPNGSIIGHREFKILYKQFYREQPKARIERLGVASSSERQLAMYNNHNQMILQGSGNAYEGRQNHKARYETKYSAIKKAAKLKLGVKGNKVLQHHFVQATP